MDGHVQEDSPNVYLLHGWKGNEDEDVDVDSSGTSSEEEIEGLKQPVLAISTAAREPVSLKKVLNFAETSVQGTFNVVPDSLAAKLRTERARTTRDVEQVPNQTIIAKQANAEKGVEESVGPGENSGTKRNLRVQPRKFNDGKRLDARRFRDHFAAKLVGSKRAKVVEGQGQGEVSSASKDRTVLDSPLEAPKGESPQQPGSKARKGSLIEEEAVMLHVNLEVEQEKGIELPCNGDCNSGNKESFQVFTRKRKQASEGAAQSEKVLNQNRNGVHVETMDERSADPKDAECTTDRPPDGPKLNSNYGRSKRARKHNRQTDYIPWSDFGRLSSKKSDKALVDSAAGTDTDSKQTRSKNSPENRHEGSVDLSKENRVSSHPPNNQDIELAERDSQKDSQNSTSMSVEVEGEPGTQLPANENGLSCPASGEEPEVLPDKCIRSLSVQDKDDHQDSEIVVATTQDGDVESCNLSNGTIDLAAGVSMHRKEGLQSSGISKGIAHEFLIDDHIESDPKCYPDPKPLEQLMHEETSASPGLHLREDLRSTREGSEISSCQQEAIEGIEPPKGMENPDHDSVCNKCKQEGQLICCDGRNCKVTFHINCLDPPLRDVPPNDWYCPRCACKRIFGGMYSVSKGIESIWDVKVGNDGSDRGAAQLEVEADHEATSFGDVSRIAAVSPSGKSPLNPMCAERFYFVKYKGVAHVHNLWLGESQISKEAPKLLMNYKKQLEQGKAPKWDPEWLKPFRIIGKRKTMLSKLSDVFPFGKDGIGVGYCIEWCVKWKNLGYEACTWESADKTPLNSAHSKKLIADYETRSAKAAKCYDAEDTCRVEAHSNSGMLVDYQSLSEVIEKLLSLWQKHTNSIAVNEIHQDRMRTAIGFLCCLCEKFAVSKPCCVVVSPLLLGEWKAAFKKWMPNSNVVVYAGSKEARNIIQRYEFYNEDGLWMVQIILTSSDILNLDIETLKETSFEALIIDECQRLKGTKTSKSLRQLTSPYRLLLLSEPIKNNLEDYHYMLQELAGGKDGTPQEDCVTLTQLKSLMSKHIAQETKQESSSPTEFWVPVKMTAFQLQQYCTLLIDKCDSLVRGKRGDIASSPQELLLKLRECCNHPFLVKPGYQESLTHLSAKELLDFGIRASGKLKLLDKMLSEAKFSNKRVLIITQIHLRAGKVSLMDVLDDYMRQQFGVDSYERLDGGVEKSKKAAAVQRFNALNSKCFVFLLDRRACGSSIKLQSVNCVVIFDSDWNPQTDIQSLLRMYSPGDLEHMAICRFYCTCTIEERVLISARTHSDLDSNHHNFTLALCQKLLRWGASKNFELFDTIPGDKMEPTDEVMYSVEMINYFLGNVCVQSFDELRGAYSFCETALFPRHASEYSKGLPLYEEKDEELAEEERVSATEFWTELLKDRQLEAPDVQVRELRTRKRVQYHEDSFDVSNTSQESVEEEEESRRKRKKVVEASENPTVAKGGRSTPVERSPSMGVDVHTPTVANLERRTSRPGDNLVDVHTPTVENLERHMSRPVDNLERTASQGLKPGAGEVSHSPGIMDNGYANRAATENRVPLGEPESTDNEAANDPTTGAKSEQQQVLLSMKADLDKLCQALQFQADTAGHVEQLLFSVGNFFKLPKEKSLLHAVELSLCWLAAEQQHYSIDRRVTLSLAESCFGVQLDKIETVYAKLEERWKKRLEQGIQQSQGTRAQDTEVGYGGEQDRVGRVSDQESFRDKHAVSQGPTNLGSSESCTARDVQRPKEGPVTSVTKEQGSAPHEAHTSATPLGGQVPVEQVQTSAGIQELALPEPSTDGHRVSLSQQHRSERSQLLINAQKNQIAALEQLERKYKQRLAQHYDSALAKFPRTPSSEEHSKLLDSLKSASSVLTNSFRAIRANLIKHQYEERGKEHRLSNPQLGTDNAVENLNRTDEFNEESIINSLPRWLRTVIETGDFGSVRTISGFDRVHCPPPYTASVINHASQGSSLSNLPNSQPVSLALNSNASPPVAPGQQGIDISESQMHVGPNLQHQRHLHQRQAQDSVLQHQRRAGALPSDPIYSQVVSSSALQNQQRQATPQQQRLPVTHPQSLSMASTPRPSSPILTQQPSLSQALLGPQLPQLVPEIQQSQPLQRGTQIPQRSGSGLSLTNPNEVAQPSSVAGGFSAPPSSGRITSGSTSASNRMLHSVQSRSNHQYQNDPLAQEFLRLRKEQDKLKTLHESEKDRIKAQFMKELELLSKKYEVMLQEEDSTYTHKASALESNLKKVEMNRRLAEVFRLKNAQDSPAVNSGISQGQNYQQHPAFLSGRSLLASAPAGLPQTSGVATASGSLFERPARVPTPSITGGQALTSPLWQYSQGLTSNIVAGLSPQSAIAVTSSGVMQSRSLASTSAPGSYLEPFRASSQLSIPVNFSIQRLAAPLANSLHNTAIVSTSALSTLHVQDSHGLNVAPVGSFVHGASNHGSGGSLGGIPTNNFLVSGSSITPQCSSTPAGLVLASVAQTLAGTHQENLVPLGSLTSFPENPGNATERLACETFASERPIPFMANDECQANENICMISAAQGNHVYANLEAITATEPQSLNVQNNVIFNGLGFTQSRHFNEGQEHGASDVICLSDDD